MNLVVHGSRAADSLIMVDGMSIINGSGSGGLQYGNYLNNSLAQEITFQTGGNSAEFERASVVSNFIPKEGSNSFRGSFQTRFSNESLESNNLDATQISQGLKSANLVNKVWDINPVGGGPMIKDRMWIYGGYRHWGTYNNVAGSFKDASFTETFYSCNQDATGNCTTEQNLFPVWHQSAAARLTTQVSPKHKVNLYYDWQFTEFGNCFVPSLSDGDQRLPRIQEHSAVHRPGKLELAGEQQAPARSRRHADRAGFPRLPPARRAGHPVPVYRSVGARGHALDVGIVNRVWREPKQSDATTARRRGTLPARTSPRSASP